MVRLSAFVHGGINVAGNRFHQLSWNSNFVSGKVVSQGGLLTLLTVAAICANSANTVSAAPPKRAAAMPASLEVTKDAGPWLILAGTYPGKEGVATAAALAKELRTSFKLNAYTHTKRFNREEAKRLGASDVQLARHEQTDAIAETAVLIGDFDAIDDGRAKAALRRVKYDIHPKCLDHNGGEGKKESEGTLSSMREMIRNSLPDSIEKKKKGPLGHAFMTPNPLLPSEFFAPSGVDKFVADMNADVKYSLLDNPGKFTVQVATFNGASFFGAKQIEKAAKKAGEGSRLQEGAVKANLLVAELRKQGVEAYEFHDREKSIVTVGSFDAIGRTLPDGSVDYAPAIKRIYVQFAADRKAQRPEVQAMLQRLGQGQLVSNVQPKTIPSLFPVAGQKQSKLREVDLIPFDVTPQVTPVPKRSLAGDYQARRR